MSSDQCWACLSDGTRCDGLAVGETYVCAAHTPDGRPPSPMAIFRAPEAEMPPALVQTIRRYAPEVSFPPAAPSPAAPLDAAGAGPAPPPVAPGPNAPVTQAAPAPPPQGEPDSYDWLLAYLREAIAGLMASEATPLQKANGVARLGSLYLKTAGAGGLKRENKALTRRIAELEQQAAAAEARVAESEAMVSMLTERHETIAVATEAEHATDRLPAPAGSVRPGAGSPPAFQPNPRTDPVAETPDDASDDPREAGEPSLTASSAHRAPS